MFHFMKAEVWDQMIKYMKLAIQVSVLGGAMLEAVFIIDHALEIDAAPSSGLAVLLDQVKDCIETVGAQNSKASEGPTDTPSDLKNVGGGGQSWFVFPPGYEDMSLTAIMQVQVNRIHLKKGVSSVAEEEEEDTEGGESTNSPEIKMQILKAALPRIEARVAVLQTNEKKFIASAMLSRLGSPV